MKCERMDPYDYLIALATLDAKDDDVRTFMELDDSDVVLSTRIVKKIEKLIRRASLYRTDGLMRLKRILSKVAIITLVIVSVVFTALMSVSAIRSVIWGVITEWYEEYIVVGYMPEEGLEVSEPPKMIEEIRKPMLLPLGVEEEIVGSGKNMFSCDYYLGDDCYVSFTQYLLGQSNKVDGDDATMTKIMVGEYDAYLFTYSKEEYTIILWNDGEYAYFISSIILEADDLIAVAASVK